METDKPHNRTLYWETKGSKATLTDGLLELVRTVEPNMALKYNKNYIGLAQNGIVTNFVQFRPATTHHRRVVEVPRSKELTQRLVDDGVNLLAYNPHWGRYDFS